MTGCRQMMSESHRLTARAEEFSSNFPRPDALEGARQIGRGHASRNSTRRTVSASHCLPVAVATPRAFNAAASA
jgi:hypothetical protein